MPYVRSRKFCCCLPVRFGVFCESLLGIAIGGFIGVVGWIEVSKLLEGSLPDVTHNEQIAIWVLAVSMTLFALTSFLGLVGAIARVRGLVALYASAITFVTVVNVVSGIYVIYQLFHGAGDAQVQKCINDAQNGVQQVNHFVCDEGFKIGRTILVVIYVLFWLIEIYGCVIAFEYVGQLTEEEDAELAQQNYNPEKQASNVTIVTQPAYAFSATPNAYGPPARTPSGPAPY